jgi:hypothetical protein
MQSKKKNVPQQQPLAKGQVWRTRESYIRVVDLGKRLVSYKVLNEMKQRAVKTHMVGKDVLETYLQTNEAKLVENGS